MRSSQSVLPLSSIQALSFERNLLQKKMKDAVETLRNTTLENSTAAWYLNLDGQSPVTLEVRNVIETNYKNILVDKVQFDAQRVYWAGTLNVDDYRTPLLISEFVKHREEALSGHPVIRSGYQGCLDIWLMLQVMMPKDKFLILNKWSLDLYNIQESIHASLAMPVFHDGNLQKVAPSTNNNLESWTDRLVLTVGFIGIAIAAITTVVGALAYAALKATKSFSNVYHGEKVGRSLFRLGAIGAGSVSGAYGGMVAGAVIGSIVPVIGTVIGAVTGAIVGSFLAAGIAAFAAKQITRLVSYLAVRMGYYGKDIIINPTNPEKYRLTAHEEHALQQIMPLHAEEVNTGRIFQMMTAVRIAKPKTGTFTDSETIELKRDYNQLLKGLKSDHTVHDLGIFVGNKNLFRWAGNHWDKLALKKPEPTEAEEQNKNNGLRNQA